MLQRAELDAGQPEGARVELLRKRILKVVFPQLAQRLFEEWGRRKRVNRPPTSADRAEIREAAIGILFRSLLTHCAESRGLPPVPVARLFSRPVAWLAPKTMSRLCLDRSEFGEERLLLDFGSLDVRLLGSIYESLLNINVRPADPRRTNGKLSARKASGTYYTPPAIVEYLVADTVGPVLDRKLDALRRKIDASGGLRPKEHPSFVAQLFDVRVLDPAMGCGHFLVETVHFIVRRLTDFLNDLPEETLDAARLRRVLAQTPAQNKLNDSQLIRRQVLERCIYGVDRDPFAVELAKATLWLDAGTIGADWRPLDEHLRCGDALLGHVRTDPRRRSNGEKPHSFNWDREFADVFRVNGGAEAADCGFDCVVGNPPYVRIQNLDEALVEHLKSSFRTAVGKFDLYLPFLERGVDLLAKEGQLGMIVPNKLLTANYGAAFREDAAARRLVRQIVDFECQQVFPGASTYCCLLFLSRDPGERIRLSRGTLEPPIAREATCLPAEKLGTGTWSVKASSAPVPAAGKPLESECRAIFQGLITGGDRLLIGRREGDQIRLGDDLVEFDPRIFRPVLKGPDVRRYSLRFSDNYVLFPYRQVDGQTELLSETQIAEGHPAVFHYLERHRGQLARAAARRWFTRRGTRTGARGRSPDLIRRKSSRKCWLPARPSPWIGMGLMRLWAEEMPAFMESFRHAMKRIACGSCWRSSTRGLSTRSCSRGARIFAEGISHTPGGSSRTWRFRRSPT